MADEKKRSRASAHDLRYQRRKEIGIMKDERLAEQRLFDSFDISAIEEAPECLLFGGDKERVLTPPRVFKVGLTCAPHLSKNQALHLRLAGWTRRPGCGHIGYGSLGGKTVSWWEDIYYRRAGKEVIVFAVAYAWSSDHDRPKCKVLKGAESAIVQGSVDPNKVEWTPEVITGLLKENLHPRAKIDDVDNLELAFYLSCIPYNRDLDYMLYVVRNPTAELWTLTDPKLFDPLGAYKDWQCRAPY